ncbi:DUF2778 domain-containing protein [Pectobacterium brasiliense]|uniref:DUF2778 domain-containing protein n=2 Tax=Pectobacterium TaxID=122277 RepID=A0A433NGR4_9GAMM|nr:MULTISPECIES: DUF2778 domain-containing protein [Pectobacterium]GKW26925.1 hypothetical protein PEC331060_01030 [Pectobacterium carotovorum subsp. carotovorum]MBN3047796.1 DUF2778 domain-containing protein [Pectobacterium brasiliense]MBN3076718.1 DUF2778 domain-containing protein [Pectobacterium brasiliense]MBN3084194.1 DUF2778 domain-containing protein [Pectobacterium brasiliense]MBN3088457.1 DUF2778 domain-containing protein [Pectobacterium brasiliense]
MPIHGRFIVNNADFSPLIMYGLGTFLAYSGNRVYRNQAGCIGIPDNGPIPDGLYHIVDRPTGGWKGMVRTDLHDFYSWPTSTPVIKYEWFALYRDDGVIDDYTWVNGIKRGNFRLHPPGPLGISLGCITLQHRTDFLAIRRTLVSTRKTKLANGLMSYGTIEVILNGHEACPNGS